MGNVPHLGVDPDGGWSWTTAAIGAGVGGLIGYGITGDWQGAAAGALAGGALGGASFNEVTKFASAGSQTGGFRTAIGKKVVPANFWYGIGVSKFPDFQPIDVSGATSAMSGIVSGITASNLWEDSGWGLGAPAPPPVHIPRYLLTAFAEMGETEISGSRHNPRIIEYLQTTGSWWNTDETPWCSAFCNWTLGQNGIIGTNDARALSWSTYGQSLNRPAVGSMAVFDYGGGRGHVGFVVGSSGDNLIILGGNQSDQVRLSVFSTDNIINYVVPRSINIHNLQYNLRNYNIGGGTLDVAGTR